MMAAGNIVRTGERKTTPMKKGCAHTSGAGIVSCAICKAKPGLMHIITPSSEIGSLMLMVHPTERPSPLSSLGGG